MGNAEREHVAGLLQEAVGAGMITLDEFSDRMSAAMAARTRGELGVLLEDLPGMELSTVAPTDPVTSVPGTLPLTVTMSSLRRAGEWKVPPSITIRSRFSSVVIDVTRAEIRTPVVTLDVDDICSSTSIVVPDDFTADLNALRCLGSSAVSKAGSTPPAGRVHLIVRGHLRFGSLEVKHPFGAWFRKNLR